MLTHHAQLIEGGTQTYQALLDYIASHIAVTLPHPDISTFIFDQEKLGVDDAHGIRDALLRMPTMTDQTIVVVYAHTLTEQAQNALLKITEEPPKNSFLFLVTHFVPHIIPTLRSRFITFVLPESAGNTHDSSPNDLLSVKDFLKAPLNKRLEIVKDIHGGMDKETISISEVWDFVNELEKEIHDQLMNDIQDKKTSASDLENQEKVRDTLDVLARTQNYMHAPGNSVKMLLEYVAMRV